ncbi:MAG: phosphoglycerate kinase [Candidatus Latescibacteria bacterium]|nr:phosphoglycerate kinase [Candidatus Latescibacterota bacterium]
MKKLSVEDLDVRGKCVLTRVDFNVPLEGTKITDEARIRESLPTIRSILDRGGRLILMSHLGRPDGKVVPKLSLKPVADRLGELLGRPVTMAPDCVGPEVERLVASLQDGDVLLLENLRFHPEEEKNDPAFSKQLASLGDLYVNDAFGTAHRAHASTEGVTRHFSQRAAGHLMIREIDYLGAAVADPKRPFVAILGGAKVSGKIDVIQNLMSKVDALLIGGGMACTFFKAQGLEIGKSLLEPDRVEVARQILAGAERKKVRLLLPVDCVVADRFAPDAQKKIVPTSGIPADWQVLDIGPETVRLFSAEVGSARTVVWNGPLGVFEMDAFAEGTDAVARALADATNRGTLSIIGGGDSAAAVAKAGLERRMTHISTGGGASLEFLEGKPLPGVAALTDK